jgi:hypothetical protein
MPRATLTFKLPEEQFEFMQAAGAGELARALSEIDQRLRGILKYGEPSKETEALAIEIREMIRELDPIVL